MRTCIDCGRDISSSAKRCKRHARLHLLTRLSRSERKVLRHQLEAARAIRWEIHRREPIEVDAVRWLIRTTALSHRECERILGWAQGTIKNDLRDGKMSIAHIDQLACWLGRHYEELVA